MSKTAHHVVKFQKIHRGIRVVQDGQPVFDHEITLKTTDLDMAIETWEKAIFDGEDTMASQIFINPFAFDENDLSSYIAAMNRWHKTKNRLRNTLRRDGKRPPLTVWEPHKPLFSADLEHWETRKISTPEQLALFFYEGFEDELESHRPA